MPRMRSFLPVVFSRFRKNYRAAFRFIFPSSIDLPVQQKRIDLIQSRIRILSGVMALCLPAWSLLDVFAFQHRLWLSLFEARLLAGFALAMFFVFGDRISRAGMRNLESIYIQFVIIFVVPTLLYIFCTGLPDPIADTSAFATAITNSYYLFPFVILAGLGFFPLTILESTGIAVPFLTAYYFARGSPDLLRWSSDLGMTWSMALLAAVSVIISSSQLSMLIKLVSYSSYDMLTSCLGRRSGEEVVKALWHYSVRKKSNFAIAFVDLDHFKMVNDCFGHQAGDAVLANVAGNIKRCIRESDFVIRWGGEEFLILLPDSTLEDAARIFTRMATRGFGHRPDGSPQTVSVGLAERQHENSDDKNYMIQIADERLYEAKISGRSRMIGSRTIVFNPVPIDPASHHKVAQSS